MTLRHYFKPVDQTDDGLLPDLHGLLSARIPAATVFLSLELLGSNAHTSVSPTAASQISLYIYDIRGYRDLSGNAKLFPPFLHVKFFANKIFRCVQIFERGDHPRKLDSLKI